ncbi:CBO0543 family protein [Bacillus sp. AK031]
MYLLLVIIVYIVFAVLFVDWKRWKEYYPTVQFFVICNLLYNFIFYNHTLWAYKAVTVEWLNHTLIEITFTLFVIPVVLMIYLRYFPARKRNFLYVSAWIAYFTILEYLFYKKGLFIYENGWSVGWSFIFNSIMFIIIRIHYKNNLIGLLISLPVIAILLLIFHPSLQDLK